MSFPIDVTVPGANNFPGDDQPLMQANFTNINGFLSVDHVNPGAVNNGFHKQVTFSAPISDPATPLDDKGYLYTKLVNTVPQLFFLNKNGTQVSATSNGSVTVLGGIILKWGFYSGPSATITFPTAFPNNCFAVFMQPAGTNPSVINDYVYVSSLTPSSFFATGTRRTQLQSNNIAAFYFAIGN